MSGPPLQVLMVCTGNICRSPMMERILRATLDRRGAGDAVNVTSAGTWAQAGEPMQPLASSTLTERGFDAAAFAATPLTEQLLRSSDLVVTATREHRSQAVGLAPGVVRRTFTLLELASIAGSAPVRPDPVPTDPVARARQAVAWAAQMRGSISHRVEGADDLGDPLGAPAEVYHQRADMITDAVEQIVPFLIGRQSANSSG